MGREKRHVPGAAPGTSAKERHKKSARRENLRAAPLPKNINALPEKNITSKHKVIFELVENTDKREKKLEFQITTDRHPPPGFEFVPIGNPELTTACKELSRENDAMIFIVSTVRDNDDNELALHMHRIGHHIRQTIVEEARTQIGEVELSSEESNHGEPEPIPETQEEINAQADAALKDLFPRIPNTDRQIIVEHAFKKGATFGGQPVVGMVADIPLSRRAQLAVLAHIRHTHTRYDQLLREVGWTNARKAVEQLCLDILVRWRGDEETGRDQFDEVLREVVVISDEDEDEDEDEENDEGEDDSATASDESSVQEVTVVEKNIQPRPISNIANNSGRKYRLRGKTLPRKARSRKSQARRMRQTTTDGCPASASAPRKKLASKRAQRGFKRYAAAAQRQLAWEQAVNRNRNAQNVELVPGSALTETLHGNPLPRHQHIETSDADYRAEPRREEGFALPSQHFLDDGPRHNIGAPANAASATNRPSLNPTTQSAVQMAPSSTRPREVVIRRYRTVVGPPNRSLDTQAGAMPIQRQGDDLKDLLVPSIEPVSPESRLGPQFVRRVPYGEAKYPEQVSSGRPVPAICQPAPRNNRMVENEFYHDRPYLEDNARSAGSSSRIMQQEVQYPNQRREPQSYLPLQEPEHRTVYRIREPLREHAGVFGSPVFSDDHRTVQEGNVRPFLFPERVSDAGRPFVPMASRLREATPSRIYQIHGAADGAPMGPQVRQYESPEASAPRFVGHPDRMLASQGHAYEIRDATPTVQYASTVPEPRFYDNGRQHLVPVAPPPEYRVEGFEQRQRPFTEATTVRRFIRVDRRDPSFPNEHEHVPVRTVADGPSHLVNAYEPDDETTLYAQSAPQPRGAVYIR